MQTLKTEGNFKIFPNWVEFSETEKKLFEVAITASTKAYAPYSNFGVGAAVLLKNGAVCEGSNQENGAFPSGLCAERVAIFHAGAKYPKQEITAMALTIDYMRTDFKDMAFPCGACRQSMLEYELKQTGAIRLFVIGKNKEVLVSENIAQLLPLCFSGNFLQGK